MWDYLGVNTLYCLLRLIGRLPVGAPRQPLGVKRGSLGSQPVSDSDAGLGPWGNQALFLYA